MYSTDIGTKRLPSAIPQSIRNIVQVLRLFGFSPCRPFQGPRNALHDVARIIRGCPSRGGQRGPQAKGQERNEPDYC
jgi:hypothetical protein